MVFYGATVCYTVCFYIDAQFCQLHDIMYGTYGKISWVCSSDITDPERLSLLANDHETEDPNYHKHSCAWNLTYSRIFMDK